jgi:2-C-methyl-D-erythritol 4-phosphate cytidylyltransferase
MMSRISCGASSPEPVTRVGAVIVAGGSGTRMGPRSGPKQYLDLLGAPVLLWSVRAFLDHPAVGVVVIVLPPADAARPPEWLASRPVTIAAGGATRAGSVRAGLAALEDRVDVVLVHDAARPLVSGDIIDRVLHAAREGPAIAALRVADTVKVEGPDGTIARTVDRAGLWLAQTPQAFPLRVLRDAHARAEADGFAATDDAALCERYGARVRLVEGSVENMKITRSSDLRIVAALASARTDAAVMNPDRNA